MLKDWFHRGRRESIDLMVGMTVNLISHSGFDVYQENMRLTETVNKKATDRTLHAEKR